MIGLDLNFLASFLPPFLNGAYKLKFNLFEDLTYSIHIQNTLIQC